MRFLADENISPTTIRRLRQAGHDILSVKESMTGYADKAVLARAIAESRVVLTFDKNFGELAFGSRLPANCGVILFRITPAGPEQDAQRIFHTIDSREDWAGGFLDGDGSAYTPAVAAVIG